MGYDEHGPAYPDGDTYRCPVCGIRDREAFLRCSSGGCPDGRDQGYRHQYSRAPVTPPRRWGTALVFWASVLAWLLWVMWPHIRP